MSCASCVASVERALQGVSGVSSVSVNFAAETAFVKTTSAPEALLVALAASGSLNQFGSFTLRAEQVGTETILAKLIELVKLAQNSKPPIARLTDSISAMSADMTIVGNQLSRLPACVKISRQTMSNIYPWRD